MYWLWFQKVWGYWWWRNELFTRKFNVIIKQCCLYVWGVEKNNKSKKPKILKIKSRRIMVSSRSVFCSCKKSRFHGEKKEASKVLSSLGIKNTNSK